MSIIKRKAGSEDIVKSVLEFDAVPTEGSPNLVESGAVAAAIKMDAYKESMHVTNGGILPNMPTVGSVVYVDPTNGDK
jgi:hypothetical protein